MTSEEIEQRQPSFLPHAALMLVQILFGTLPVIGKFALAAIPAPSLVACRIIITAIALTSIQLFRGRLWLKNREDYKRLAVLSLFGVVLNQFLFIGGLSFTTASNTSLLAVTIPIFTLIVSYLAGKEEMRPIKIIGVLVAAIGVLILIDPRKASLSSATTLGDIMIVINSLSFGIYVVISKDVITRNGAVRSIAWLFIFGTIPAVVLGGFAIADTDLSQIPIEIWLSILYIGIGATTLPYLLNAFAIIRVKPSTLAVYIYLQPIIGFVSSALILNEKIGPAFIVAAALVFLGVFLASRRRKPLPIRINH